ncbi:carbohydrate ABC transporter permease [Candidatus Phytoplasma luffae]|uniref:carbohydrate ABC transporter permease n=1 Tax=Loofah witches'-broom phytoplasma TaxID=35773 RepID=UPI001B398FAF|nr:carbohydrate ABC transporter permease [Candidatus Phytoplasma luffae]
MSWPNKWKLWENYKESVQLNSSSFLKLFWNTFRITFFSTLLGTICSILTSYVLSILKINSRLKSIMIIFLLLSLMTVSETLVLTNYRTVSDWGWVNHGKDSEIPFGNDYALIFPFLINTIHILLLIKTFNQIPKELYLSAKIDGTSDWKYLWKIIVPIAKPTIIVTVIFRIVAAWNAYSWPALIGAKLLTNVTRANFNTDSGMEKINIQMATAILINVPLFFIFICFKKYIISGANRSGIKG